MFLKECCQCFICHRRLRLKPPIVILKHLRQLYVAWFSLTCRLQALLVCSLLRSDWNLFHNLLHDHLLAFFLHNLLWSLNSLIDVNFLLGNYAWWLYQLVYFLISYILNVFNNWSRDIVLWSTGQDGTISTLNKYDAICNREFRPNLDFLWLWLRWRKSRLVLDVEVHRLIMFLLLIRGCSRDVRYRIRLV